MLYEVDAPNKRIPGFAGSEEASKDYNVNTKQYCSGETIQKWFTQS